MKVLLQVLFVVAIAGCGSTARPPTTPLPLGEVAIDVEIDGAPSTRIDAARLERTPPDFSRDGLRAWRLGTLLGSSAERPDVVVEATGEGGLTMLFRRERVATEPAPVLALTRRGEVVVAVVRPSEPFPEYHGRGGGQQRPGDPLPRLQAVTKLRVYLDRGERSAPAPSPAGVGPQVTMRLVDGTSIPLTASSLERVARVKTEAVGMERDAWSLREIVSAFAGADARVVAVVGDGTRKELSAHEWSDTSRVPILRIGSGGHRFKFRWIEKDGKLGEAEVKDVLSVELGRR